MNIKHLFLNDANCNLICCHCYFDPIDAFADLCIYTRIATFCTSISPAGDTLQFTITNKRTTFITVTRAFPACKVAGANNWIWLIKWEKIVLPIAVRVCQNWHFPEYLQFVLESWLGHLERIETQNKFRKHSSWHWTHCVPPTSDSAYCSIWSTAWWEADRLDILVYSSRFWKSLKFHFTFIVTILNIALRDGSLQPNWKNFTCNIFTISTHFFPLVT